MKTSKIISIKTGFKPTYDITVSNNHNFYCNNHLIHNCGYTGELQVILFNTTNQKVKIEVGQKIAQAVLCPVVSGKWVSLVEKSELITKDREDNGFGSTGI